MNNIEFGSRAKNIYGINLKEKSCYFCDNNEPAYLDVHHVIPRRMGGTNDLDNLIVVCKKCHKKIENVYDDNFYANLKENKNCSKENINQKQKSNFSIKLHSTVNQLIVCKDVLKQKLIKLNVSSYNFEIDKIEKTLVLTLHRDMFPNSFRNKKFDDNLPFNYRIFSEYLFRKLKYNNSFLEKKIEYSLTLDDERHSLDLDDDMGCLKEEFGEAVKYYEYFIDHDGEVYGRDKNYFKEFDTKGWDGQKTIVPPGKAFLETEGTY